MYRVNIFYLPAKQIIENIWNKISNSYFTKVSKIIEEALHHPVSKTGIRKIAEKGAIAAHKGEKT